MNNKYLKKKGFRHFFRGLTPLKFKILDRKLKISNNNQNFAQRSYWESIINRPFIIPWKLNIKKKGFRHSFRGLTPLKFKILDKKLKTSNSNQNFAQRSYWESIMNRPFIIPWKLKIFKKNGFRNFFRGLNL